MQFIDTTFLRNADLELRVRERVEADPKYGKVPVYYFDMLDCDKKKIGECELRVGHSDEIYYYGNILCKLYPQFEGYHYGLKATKLLLLLAKAHNMGYISITCKPNDERCKATCEQLGMVKIDETTLPSSHPLYGEGYKSLSIYVMDIV